MSLQTHRLQVGCSRRRQNCLNLLRRPNQRLPPRRPPHRLNLNHHKQYDESPRHVQALHHYTTMLSTRRSHLGHSLVKNEPHQRGRHHLHKGLISQDEQMFRLGLEQCNVTAMEGEVCLIGWVAVKGVRKVRKYVMKSRRGSTPSLMVAGRPRKK